MLKAEKGETVAGHKYLERKPDGKGGWQYRYLPGHAIEITPHEKTGFRGTFQWRVTSADDTHAHVAFHASTDYGHKIPHDALAHYKNDLEGRVESDKPSGDPDIDAVTSGKAEFLGKGDDGLVFRSGDNVVKVSTVVPYQPTNPSYKTPQRAVEVAREQHETQQVMRDAGVPGLLPERFVEHDGRGYTIKAYVDIPEKLSLEQLEAAHDTVLAMHKAGYVLGDTPQVGVDENGKVFMFDVGKAYKPEPSESKSRFPPQEDDLEALSSLYTENGQEYVPRGDNLKRKWEQRVSFVLKFPPRVDAARDKQARDLIAMAHALRKDADKFDRLVIDGDLTDALQKLERPEQIDVAKLLEQAPAAVKAELPQTAARAVKVGARAGTLELLGAGAEGLVFTDGVDVYKVGRAGSSSRQNEAEALEVLHKDPRTKNLVPSFGKYDAANDVIVRGMVEGRTAGWGTEGLWEAHEKIAKVLREHEFTAPEFKENSFVIEGGKPKMIDVGFVHPIGKRAAAALSTKIEKLRAIDFQTDTNLALDLSLDLFPTYDEGAMTLDTLREHVAKIRELAPERKFKDLQFEERLKQRENEKSGVRKASDGAERPGHKYLARNPDGKGGWQYAYAEAHEEGAHFKTDEAAVARIEASVPARLYDDENMSMRVVSRGDAIRKAKGDEKADHKYLERHPDGKGGWHYVYGMQNRPISTFTVPKGFVATGKHPAFRHGTVTYLEPLPKEDQGSFDLQPIASEEGRKHVIAHAINQLAGYRDEYADLANEPDGRRMIEPVVRQSFGQLGAHIEGSDDAVTEVIASLRNAPLEKARKLHRRRDFRGLQISVENQTGSIRHWYDSHAKRAGQTKMKNDYGYIRRTEGADGDHVDVYVGPDKTAPYVFVIDQLKSPDFVRVDEQKVMLGFSNLGEAVQAYRAHYDDPRFLGQVRAVAFEDFVAFVTDQKNHGELIKAAKGAEQAGHKYLTRKPDGKGGWRYEYADASHGHEDHTAKVADPRTMQPRAINKEMAALDAKSREITSAMIAAGHGHETYEGTHKRIAAGATDPLTLSWLGVSKRVSALRAEIERRMGPAGRYAQELPKGFGPIKKAEPRLILKSYVVQRYSPSQEPPDFEGIYGTAQTEKEVNASRRRRKALAKRNSGKYAFHGAAPEKSTLRFAVRDWATIKDAAEAGKR